VFLRICIPILAFCLLSGCRETPSVGMPNNSVNRDLVVGADRSKSEANSKSSDTLDDSVAPDHEDQRKAKGDPLSEEVEDPLKEVSESDQYSHGKRCTVDCGGHEAGYEWAERKGIIDKDDCGGKSRSFIEGCESYVEENHSDISNRDLEDHEDNK
jgi:hypothetical protein